MLQEIKKRLQASTPGPWVEVDDDYIADDGGHIVAEMITMSGDRELIANAPTDIAFLSTEVERLQKIEAEAKTLISWVHFGNDGFAHVQKVDFYRLAGAINDTEIALQPSAYRLATVPPR